MKRDEFEKLIGEIGRGADVDQEELVEVLGYAGSAWYEIQQLTRQLCAGYRALQRDIKRKDQKLEVYMKMLDGLLFVHGRRIRLNYDGEITLCQRPLRAQTMQGERIALASSEALPAGTWFECEIEMLDPSLEGFVREALDYGKLFGISQWRSSGKGRFEWEEIK